MASDAPGRRAAAPAPPVRPIRPADLPAVLAIERASFAIPWTERAFRHVMEREDGAVLVVEGRDDGLAGYAAYWVASDEAELADLAVRPELRRRGYGGALVEAVRRAARARGAATLFLQVRESNAGARSLYRDAGFAEVGRRERYYRRPVEDAVVLSLPLGPSAD